MALLAESRVPEYWIVDPKQNTLEIYVLAADGYELTGVYDDNTRVESPTLPDRMAKEIRQWIVQRARSDVR